MNPLVIYCDASAPHNRDPNDDARSGWGAVFVRGGRIIGEASGELPRIASVAAEFKAVRCSLDHALAKRFVRHGYSVIVASDCAAVEQYLTPGRSWNSRIELAALALGIRRVADTAGLALVATWVKGHNGGEPVHGKHNARADRLARQAAGVIPTDEEMLASEEANRERMRERSRQAAEARRERGRENLRVDLEWQRLKRERWHRLQRNERLAQQIADGDL